MQRRPASSSFPVAPRQMPLLAALFVLSLAGFEARPSGMPLDPQRAISQYVHTVWQTEQGLPQNSVQAIVQTRDGYLWLGTQEGLVRFDGVRFTVFDKKNTPGLRHGYVWALCEDRDGGLWIGTVGGGVSLLKDGRFTAFGTQEGLSNDFVRAISQDRDGNVWIGTDKGLNLFRDGKLTRFPAEQALGGDHVRAILEDRGRHLWVGTDGGGLVRIEAQGRVTRLGRERGLPSERVSALHQDGDGTLWVGTQGGLTRLLDGGPSTFTTRQGLSNDIVLALYGDRSGSLWVGTYGGGLDRYANGRFSAFGTKDGLSNDIVYALLQDREGSLWIGTGGGGLNCLKAGRFATLTTQQGLSSDLALSVYEDRAGALWVGTAGSGLNRLKDGQVTTLTTRDGLSSDVVFSTHEDRAGNLWIGTDGGLDRLKDGRLTHLTTRDGLSSDRVRALHEDQSGTLWIGTDGGGVNLLKGGKLARLTTREGLTNDIVVCIFEDRAGSVWVGTEGGLNRVVGEELTRFTTRDGLSNDFVFSMHEDPDGGLWVGTFSGLNRLKAGTFTRYTTREGLFDDVVARILEDGQGYLWMSSNRGISRVRRADLDALAEGRLQAVRSTAYGTADGMRSAECNGGFQPAGWKTRDGRLWFPTVRGVVEVDPLRLAFNDVPPPVLVERLVVDGRQVDTTRDVELPPDAQNLEFHYTAPAFRAPERMRFKYRLEGQDRDWVEAGTRRTAYYTNIPHGVHAFRVMAANDDGVWSDGAQSLEFRLRPHFYETWWFAPLCALAGAFGLRAAHRARVRHLTQRQQELLALVDERTRDLRLAQEKISHLLQAAPKASQSIPAWSRALTEDIASAIGAERIDLWELDRETLTPLSDSGMRAPTLEVLRGLVSAAGQSFVDWDDGTLVPVTGPSGELCGALVIAGRARGWDDTQRRLMAGLAHQLGGTLEMSRMRRQLAAAQERKADTLRDMHERGIATLQICPACGRCYDHTVPTCAEDGAPLEAPRLLPYLLLERYRLLRVLGQGGMGMVLLAHDEKLARDVAVKLIAPEHFGKPEAKQRFEREARTVARIQHEGVIALHDSGELKDGTAFLVMERLEGCDLGLLLKTCGPGTARQVAALVRQGCAALSAAHRAGVVHRDIKPENIFLVGAADGLRVKLLDFGLAKSMTFEKGLTQTGMVMGTPKYMSPEQVRGEELDGRSDVYSFATVCYEALVGRKAILGDDLGRILINVLHTLPPPVSSLRPGVPPEVDAALEFALAKDPARRLTNVELLVSSLAEPLERLPPDPAVSGWPSSREALAALAKAHAQDGSRTGQPGPAQISTGATAARLRT